MQDSIIVYLILIILIIAIYFILKNKITDKKPIIEGIIIGVVSGFILSYSTDVNFQAKIHFPFIKIAQIFNNQVRYVSKNWADIEVSQYDQKTDIVSVEATNIASGVTVKIADKPLGSLPADLRYDIETGGILYTILKPK